jgi:hypothetical protein
LVHSRQKPRLLPAVDGVMSAEIAAEDRRRRRQKPRLLPPRTKPMSAEIAAGNFGQLDQFSLI